MLSNKRWLLVMLLLSLASTDAWAAGKGPKQKQAEGLAILLVLTIPAAFVLTLGGLGLQTAYRATFVRRSDRIAAAAAESPVKCTIVGAANTALLLLLMAITGEKLPPVAAAVLVLLALLAFMGLAAKAENLGVRIARAGGHEASPIMGLVIGWPAMVGMLLVPFAGWAVVAYMLVSGVGATLLSFLRGKARPE